MLKDHEFKDKDIEDVIIDLTVNVELGLKQDTEAVLIYKEDAIALAKHFGITCADLVQ